MENINEKGTIVCVTGGTGYICSIMVDNEASSIWLLC